MSTAKAQNYLALLEIARCEGNWSAVPELVRKVRKHAPERACLTLAALTEAQIAEATQSSTENSTPTSDTLQVAQQLPKLVEAIENESTYPQDRFQATICAGWLHWVVGEYSLAALRLPNRIDEEYPSLQNPSEWTTVCALKAAYLKGNCAARTSQPLDALSVFETGLAAMDGVWGADKQPRRQLRYWAELFLSEYSMLSSQVLSRQEKALQDLNSLSGFRSWSRYWESLVGPVIGGQGFRGSVPRRRIWYEYYVALSNILELDLPLPTAHVKPINETSARTQLRIELKKTESAYEALLLDETQFPKADEEREEVEAFVQLAMKNWSILCGRGWKEADLGQGGRASISRGVLDILYRAATKTYHSTAILRHLVTVHLAVAEFDIAFKAFDSYMEVVKKAKARVEKTGVAEPSLDDDNTVLKTMSQAIVALCRYGGASATEKAHDLARELEDTMAHLPQLQPASEVATPIEPTHEIGIHTKVAGDTLAFAWQAIGLAHASWSRVTPDAPSRTEIQAKAIRSLRKSLSPAFGRSRDVQSLYSLGLLLAERRDIGAAIEVVKAALVSTKSQEPNAALVYGPYWQERAFIPVWHLLALLLSARQDFMMAARACEGAFEQFKDPSVLFGSQQVFHSEHLKAQAAPQASFGLVDELDDAEREAILEVKMTQLALIELLEGPEIAVNASYELITLYSRLFGSTATTPKTSLQPPPAQIPPKSSSGTVRSFRGSIFGSRAGKSPSPAVGATALSVDVVSAESRPLSTLPGTPSLPSNGMSSPTAAPTPAIQITTEKNGSAQRSTSAKPTGGRSSRRSSIRNRDRSASGGKRASSSGPNYRNVPDGEAFFSPEGNSSSDAFALTSRPQASIASAFVRRQNVGSLDTFISTKAKGLDHLVDHAIDGVFSLPPPLPPIVFSKDEEKRQRSVILIRLWLMVAGFYRRADMVEDAKGAVAEAQKLVQTLETELTNDATGSLILKVPKWAEKRSVDELWADVWAEFGNISLTNDAPLDARRNFESALTYFPNHAAGIVGLSNILLDIYTEDLVPVSHEPSSHDSYSHTHSSVATNSELSSNSSKNKGTSPLTNEPLGLGPNRPIRPPTSFSNAENETKLASESYPDFKHSSTLPHKCFSPEPRPSSLPLIDRLAARDRAYGLLSALTKRGSGWNNSEAWFALSRAYEESGQPEKAKDVLWWCVDLEEGRAIRDWSVLGDDGYIL
ncbi:putative cargo-transport protein ypp1 [Ceratocystis platani]|uniref:Putative cargo-transport protein ypp1 n=1 Tax=Ceratocystis fimbriata f. sp. platani TaxID=88771 RepID=A0A0F8D3V4_CERFI|nr:putative cargo-transport protein ypp1 [Ceratocystis platani]